MLTVLVATRNRASLLAETLSALERLEPPPEDWRLVVVDNGSRDRTPEVLRAASTRLPLTRVEEPRPGKNRALNAGLAAVEGDLVLFTDDDVVPRSDWLVRMREAAAGAPRHTMFGGPVHLRWATPPADWLRDWVRLGPTFAHRPAGRAGPTDPRLIFGPNMAIRAAVFRAGMRFDARLGPRGRRYVQGGETDLLLRLAAAGHQAWHCPDAVVEHSVRADQMTRDWILDRAVRFGRGEFRLEPFWRQDAPTGYVLALASSLAAYLRHATRVALARRRGPREEFASRWELAYRRGRLIESLRGRRPAPRAAAVETT